MDAPREILVALPGGDPDFYRQHQHVWSAVEPLLRDRRSRFVYRLRSPRLACVRSDGFSRGAPSRICEGRVRIDMVAKRRSILNGAIFSVADDAFETWIAGVFARNGLAVSDVSSTADTVRGYKPQTAQALWLPIRRVTLTLRVQDTRLAETAWAHGIGHGKRFGFGMLVPA